MSKTMNMVGGGGGIDPVVGLVKCSVTDELVIPLVGANKYSHIICGILSCPEKSLAAKFRTLITTEDVLVGILSWKYNGSYLFQNDNSKLQAKPVQALSAAEIHEIDFNENDITIINGDSNESYIFKSSVYYYVAW